MGLIAALKSIFGFAIKAFKVAQSRGLTDQLVAKALAYAREAAIKFVDTAERREWVVAKLKAAGISESLARLALELAVQQLKKEAGV